MDSGQEDVVDVKLSALKEAVSQISEHGCRALIERERQFGELIGRVDALCGRIDKLSELEEAVNQLIGQHHQREVNTYFLATFVSAVVSAIVGSFMSKKGGG